MPRESWALRSLAPRDDPALSKEASGRIVIRWPPVGYAARWISLNLLQCMATLSKAEGGSYRGLRITSELTIPLSEVTVRASRSSGPGGQHANVTASRVEASFEVLASPTLTETQRDRIVARVGPRVVAIAQDERSQVRNRELALARLAERIASALAVPKHRRATRPTAASRERRLQAKRQRTERKRERRPPED
jgi:ribosome-associated protein